MYEIINNLHSWLRWIMLLLMIAVLFKAYTGWFGNKAYTKQDNGLSAALLGLTHTQLLLGLILYIFLSPTTQLAFQNFGAAMKDKSLRFFAVEHLVMMLLAVVAIQLGRTFSKKASSDTEKFKKLAIYTTIGFFLILAGIPWDRL